MIVQTSERAPIRWLRSITPADEARLHEAAQADEHGVIAPTHVFTKGKDLIGYASVAAVPLVLPWFDRRHCQARDSLYFINQLENLTAAFLPANSPGLLCVPFVRGSPFEPHIERLGYQTAGLLNLCFKKVK